MGVFSERLKEAMVSRKMTATKLAIVAGMAKSSISQYLSGKNEPSSVNLKRIANALDVSPDWLSGKVEETRCEAVKNLSVEDAAKLMGVGKQCVREGLKRGSFPFGCAVRMQGRYRYYISPRRFAEFTGIEI